jgi:hypothetical protein
MTERTRPQADAGWEGNGSVEKRYMARMLCLLGAGDAPEKEAFNPDLVF